MYLSNLICSHRPFLLRAGFRAQAGFPWGGGEVLLRENSHSESSMHPDVSCPPRFPEGVECSRVMALTHVEPAPRRPTQGRADRRGGREDAQRRTPASPRQRQPTRPAHWPSPRPPQALRPHDLTEPPRRLLGVGIVSYRWGNRGAERVDGWLESVSGWRAAFSSTPPPRGGAGRSSPSSPTPLPWPCWVPGRGPQPRPPALVSHLPLCRRPRGLGLLLSVLSFQAQEAGASNVW